MKRWITLLGAFLSILAVGPAPALAQDARVEAAKKEGKVVWYTSLALPTAEKIGKLFEAAYPGIKVEVQRTGSQRILQRVMQEQQANLKLVDVIHTSDAGHFVLLKEKKLLMKYTPAGVDAFPAGFKDKDGYYFTLRATVNVIAYNTKLVSAAEAPKTWKDLLDPKWKGKLVKAHPGYSGTSLTGTFAITKLLGWDYLEKLSKQGVQQLQSTTATPKSIASGERAAMVDGNEYNMFIEIEAKSQVKIVYPVEGTPFVTSPTAVFADAPHPNAARVLQNFLYTAKVQQMAVDEGGTRSAHPDVKDPPGRTPLSQIKLLPDDPVAMLPQIADIKKRYTALFGN
jgi:iron(III) transport system substrate-binding protein